MNEGAGVSARARPMWWMWSGSRVKMAGAGSRQMGAEGQRLEGGGGHLKRSG